MRSHMIIAGIAATASAAVTVTQTEDVTVTYCAPTVTNCPGKGGYNWEPVPAKPTGPAGKPPGGWNDWKDVPENQRTWSEWKAQPTPWVPAPVPDPKTWSPVGPDGKPWSPPVGKPPGGWDNWKDVPEAQRTWSEWKAQPTPWNVWVDGKPPAPAQTWVNVPGKPVEPAQTWVNVPGKPVEPATGTWVNVPGKPVAPATGTWVNVPVTPVAATGTWVNVPVAPTAACPQYTASAPPDWFKNLPSSALSSMSAKWTGAPPADWCYWSYTTPAVMTSTVPAGASWSGVPVQATTTGWNNSPVKGYTGAANNNAGSVAMVGLAGLAAIMLA